MEVRAAKAEEYIPDWLLRVTVLYGAGMLIYALVGIEFSGFFNRGTLNILQAAGISEGSIYQNMWIGGVVEPLMSKWFPLIIIGFFGPFAAMLRILGVTAVVAVPVFFVEQLGHSVSNYTLTLLFAVGVLALMCHHLMTEGQNLTFPDEYRQRPWVTGCVFGATFGLVEFHHYVTYLSTEVFLRIGPLLMHTLLGGIICGTWIILSHCEENWRNEAIAWAAVAFAMAFHVTFNTWLVKQDWYREFWMGVVSLV